MKAGSCDASETCCKIDGPHLSLAMSRKRRVASQPGHRICQRCEVEMPATPENFVTDSSRPLGVGYECKSCHAARRKGRDRSKETSSSLSGERREKWKARQRRYFETERGRASQMRARYNQIDACDLSVDEVETILAKPCHYCGTTERKRGFDRIDHTLPHVRGNVLPSCPNCNSIRGSRMTVEEARAHIQKIMRAGNVGNQGKPISRSRVYG